MDDNKLLVWGLSLRPKSRKAIGLDNQKNAFYRAALDLRRRLKMHSREKTNATLRIKDKCKFEEKIQMQLFGKKTKTNSALRRNDKYNFVEERQMQLCGEKTNATFWKKRQMQLCGEKTNATLRRKNKCNFVEKR